MKTIAVIILSLFLVACASNERDVIIKTKLIPIEPPAAARVCPDAPQKPTGDYTQADVADYIIDLRLALSECQLSSDILDDYIIEARQIIEKESDIPPSSD